MTKIDIINSIGKLLWEAAQEEIWAIEQEDRQNIGPDDLLRSQVVRRLRPGETVDEDIIVLGVGRRRWIEIENARDIEDAEAIVINDGVDSHWTDYFDPTADHVVQLSDPNWEAKTKKHIEKVKSSWHEYDEA